MTTLYCNKSTGKLYKIDERLTEKFASLLVQIGNPVTIEYKRIKISSTKFDMIGTTDVMITTTVKSVQTKEASMESITYYDKDVSSKSTGIKINNGLWNNEMRSHTINKFDPTEYGNSVCYYNPGYSGGTINTATKFWNINDSSYIKNIMSYVKNMISLTKILPTPVAPYISLVDGIIDNTTAILVDINDNELLEETHLASFSNAYEYEPFLTGFYICLPKIKDLNEIEDIIRNYVIMDCGLVKKVAEDQPIVEYAFSYFILDVSNKPRQDLISFDFAASSNELLGGLYKNEPKSVTDFIKLSNESNDLNIIKQIHDLTSKGLNNIDKGVFNSLYNHLSEDSKILVKKLLPLN
jgi:hypothetical protein